jgi:endonuclease/exonuclease/phosphatase (EEP) superfamily protein YafD
VISTILGAILIALGVVALAAPYLPIPGHTSLIAVMVSPLLILAAPLAVVVLLWGRHWVLAAGAVVLTAVLIAVQLPWYMRTSRAPDSVAVRTMTVNMLYGRADAPAVTRVATDSADIVMVQEITPDAVVRLKAAGMDETFPYSAIDARPGAAGTALYSRYPMTDHRNVDGFQVALVTARLQVDGVGTPLSVASVHLDAPWPQPIGKWHNDFFRFPTILTQLADQSGSGATIVAGDFNATIEMRPFRELLTNGYHDSAEQAGAGRQFTYPDNKRYPPLIGIDHILTRNATAVTTEAVKIPDTDHRALLATIMVPRS